MEVYSQFIRKLLVSNSSFIFPADGQRGERSGNYGLLVEQMQKITQDPQQAIKIAEAIEPADESIFRDFDLSALLDHFKLDPFARLLLGAAFIRSSKDDLALKGKAIIVRFHGKYANRNRQRRLGSRISGIYPRGPRCPRSC